VPSPAHTRPHLLPPPLAQLGGVIKDKLGLSCIADSRVAETMRGIRSQMTSLIEGLDSAQLRAMQLGLGHTLSRYKLKFSPDKVDTMIVQGEWLLPPAGWLCTRVLLSHPTFPHTTQHTSHWAAGRP
jgi:hypothetical protein